MGEGYFQNFEGLSLGILGYHWLTLATIYLVVNNRKFNV